MIISDKNRCPNHICDGDVKIKYLVILIMKKLILIVQQTPIQNPYLRM